MTSEIDGLKENLNINQNNVFLSSQRLESLRVELDWNKQELDNWLDKTKNIEEDAQVLEKYSRADEAKIKELSLNIENLTTSLAKVKRSLDIEITETHVNQIALEKVMSDWTGGLERDLRQGRGIRAMVGVKLSRL